MKKLLIITTIVLISVMFVAGYQVYQGKSASFRYDQTPRLANIFFRWDITEAEAKELAKWDILLVDMEVQHYSPDSLRLIREYNPDIKILVYLASQEVRGDSGTLTGTLRKKLYDQIENEWWLRDIHGNQIQWWPGNPIVNITNESELIEGKRFYDVLPWFVENELMSTGLWDGVFYDNVWEGIDFLESFEVDLDGDGQAENKAELGTAWKQAMNTLLSNTRNILGDDYLIIGNGGEGYYNYLNGSLYEHFPEHGWSYTLNQYRFVTKNGYSPAIGILNTNVNNTGNRENYQKMRYGLTSSMLGDGFYSFDSGDQSHTEIWWYDEYESFLGAPIGEPENILDSDSQFKDGLWRREYENGLVLVNSTDQEYIVDLQAEYEKIHGVQAPDINDGSFVTKVVLPAKDGLILLKSVQQITGSSFVNGSFARIFDEWGNVERTGFFSYISQFAGSTKVLVADINKDGKQEMLMADESKIEIFDSNANRISTFYPYDKNYNQGINMAIDDLDNNGTIEIITGTENGGGPHIRIFNSDGKLINPGFFAYAENYRGGVNIATGDLDGNGTREIIAGAGVGGGPHVRVFSKDGKLINPGFFAYDEGFRGGVNVAAGDIDGDGLDEIITGPGYGDGPHVKIFDRDGNLRFGQFFAFDKSLKSGVEVAAEDLDGDNKVEIIATTTDVFGVAF